MADKYDVGKAIEGIETVCSILCKSGCILTVLRLDTSVIDKCLDGLKEAERILKSKRPKE